MTVFFWFYIAVCLLFRIDIISLCVFRGKCQVIHYQDIGSARAFKPSPDVFFYVLGYNPHTKRLATTQGEIRVGSSHQVSVFLT